MVKRVRVKGDLYHGQVPEGSIYCGRAAPGLKASPFANPFTLKKHSHDALHLYAEHLDAHPELVERARVELAGRDLACWCRILSNGGYVACHGDILLSLANNLSMTEVVRENIRWAEGQAQR